MSVQSLSFYETLTLLVAVVAAIISFVSLYRTTRLAKRQLELQQAQATLAKLQHEILARDEAAKRQADVRIRLVERDRSYRIVVSNRGPGIAKDVIFEEFVDDGLESPVIESEKDALFPIPQLLPGEEVSMLASVHLGTALQFSARAIWINEEGSRREQFSQVTT